MKSIPLCSPSPVAMLETALALAVQLLIARHPDLLLPDEVPRIRPPPGLRNARALVALINMLLAELASYDALGAHDDRGHRERVRQSAAPSSDDDIPF